MTQIQSTPTNQQHVWLQSGLWLRQSDNDQSERAYPTQREAIRAAQEDLIKRGGGQITIDVPSAVKLTEAKNRLPDLSSIALRPDSIQVEIVEGVPIFRAAERVQERIEDLMYKLRESEITPDERKELEGYEEFDLYFSYVNRLLRNIHLWSESG